MRSMNWAMKTKLRRTAACMLALLFAVLPCSCARQEDTFTISAELMSLLWNVDYETFSAEPITEFAQQHFESGYLQHYLQDPEGEAGVAQNKQNKLKSKLNFVLDQGSEQQILEDRDCLLYTSLYQADWLLRFYGFDAEELLSEKEPNFNPLLDPKCNWAINHMQLFPLEINRCPYEMLLRIPGIGVRGAGRIYRARKMSTLDFSDLKRLGIALKRAKYFITCKGRAMPGVDMLSLIHI